MDSISKEKSLFPMHRVGKPVNTDIVTISGGQSNRRHERQSTLCLIFLLIILILLIAAIAVALVFALSQPRLDEPTEAPNGAVQVSMTTSLQQEFTEDLLEESSEAYRQLEEKFVDGMMEVFNNGSLAEYFISLEVTGFRSGSVVVHFTVTLFELPPGVSSPDELITNANFQALLREEVQRALNNGNLSGLPADSSTVAVIEINFLSTPPQIPQTGGDDNPNTVTACSDQPCMNGGTCDVNEIEGFLCRCPSPFTGVRCQEVLACPPLDPLNDGVISCTMGSDVSSRCTHTCNQGFFLLGLPDRTCREDQRWTNVPPVCETPACPLLPEIENAVMSCSRGNANQSVCTYRCLDGFTLQQEGNFVARVCRSGQWTGSPPFCISGGCRPLEAPPNSMIVCNDMANVGSSCITVCDAGFSISDDQNQGRQCLESGLWTGFDLTCIADNTCPDLPPVDQGPLSRVCTNDFFVGSSCIYQCDAGFVLVGGNILRCGADETWDLTPPTCEEETVISCRTLTGTLDGGDVRCTNGEALGSTCLYTCNEGLVLSDSLPTSSIRTCGLDGQWSGSDLTCTAVTCPTTNGVTDGLLESCTNGAVFNSVCTYSCQIGFDLIGSSTRTCLSSGAWDVGEPSCQAQECPSLPPISNGEVICLQGSELDSVCVYTCNPGYLSVPRGVTRTCESNLQWSGQAPTCQPITCPDLTGSLSGGTVSCTDNNNFMSVCTYSCSAGFVSNTGQDSVRTCQAVGQWSGQIIGCFAAQCPALIAPANGNILCDNGNMIGSTCTFTCQDGFAVLGNSQLVCQVSGVWLGETPSCQRVTCPDLGAIPNGIAPSCTDDFFAGSVCTYSCNDGFQIAPGSASRTCDPQTGTWSGSQPTCGQVTCPVLNGIANGAAPICTNGFLAGSVCTYSCNDGFQIVPQSASRICDPQTGTWSGVEPTCEQVTCPILQPISNGNLQSCTNGFSSGSVCMYSCIDGFMFQATGSRTCSDAGEWSIPIPLCVQVTCPSLQPIPNGNLQSCTNVFNSGSVCTYSCIDGFMFQATGSRTCSDAGEWSIPIPLCVQVTCPNLGAIPNGVAPSCTDDFFAGSVCTYSCNVGFQIAPGSASRTCDPQTGTWIEAEPTCEQVTCPVLNAIANGAAPSCTNGFLAGSECTYSCNDGFQIAPGSASRTCDPQTAMWIGTEPTCEQVLIADCEQLPEVTNAVMQCSDGIAPNSVCTYTCSNGWALAAGHDGTRTCQVDGTWSNQQPACEVTCGTTPGLIQARIVNGELSSPGAWPWLASLRTSSGNHQCGGTLIDREWVLTAAHCIVDTVTTIVLGDLLLDTQTSSHQEFEIVPANRFRHPNYNDFSQRNDIALIKLPQPAVYDDLVRPLCLNTNMDEETAFPNNCFVAGWGFTEEDAGVASNELYEAEIPFFDRTRCEQLFFIVGITSTQFCAGFTVPGPDSCQGDSGGPYMCYNSTSDSWTDVGVVSYGIGCGDGQTPGVYSRISQYMDFITTTMTNN